MKTPLEETLDELVTATRNYNKALADCRQVLKECEGLTGQKENTRRYCAQGNVDDAKFALESKQNFFNIRLRLAAE